MARTFNLGCRFEVMLPARHAAFVVETAERFGVLAQAIGRCEASPVGNRLTAKTAFGDVEF
jgi:phosphoribosylformylglycinamidine cyclo-ligase